MISTSHGGTVVEFIGHGFSTVESDISVTIDGIDCPVQVHRDSTYGELTYTS
jgi:hypothetical protein